ncbi:MAG: hypothetical protein ABSG12_02825 [Steroidobacteraceae bacterium]|jgi:hypothetical protein
MNSPSELQNLLRRETEIQDAMRRPGGIRITVERELYAIREQLRRYGPPPSPAKMTAAQARK